MRGFPIEAVPCHTYSAHMFHHFSILWFNMVTLSAKTQPPTPIFVGESPRWCVHQHLHIVMASWRPAHRLQDLPWRRRHRGGDPVLVRRRRGGCTCLRFARRAEGEDHDPVHSSVMGIGCGQEWDGMQWMGW